MSETINIPKDVSTKDDLDFEFLRQKGLEYIESLGSKLWTDYNVHDPGITILEMLCYAITDLSQRIEMPIENLLASETDNFKKMHQQFLSAVHILPSKPVTALDYRKLFVHLKEVKNAWIVKHDQKVYLNCKNGKMSYAPFDVNAKDQKEFGLKGLNDIYLDLEKNVVDREAVFEEVKEIYHRNRNLCEDLVAVHEIPEHHISICVYLDIAPEADEEKIQALIIKKIDDYLSPPVPFYSLQQMYDKGYTTDKIFEGPIPFLEGCIEPNDFQGGFVDDVDLKRAELRTQVRLSDIIQLIMKIEGVLTIKDISIKTCGDDNGEQDPWIICVKNSHKPVLCWKNEGDDCKDCGKSIFNFSKGLLPIGVNESRVIQILNALEIEEKKGLSTLVTEDVPFALGSFSDSGAYTTIQNDFPETYGISPEGLSSSAPKERKAKAKQLKAYLLFFDQVLANYFSHLSKAKDLLSVDENLKRLYTVNTLAELTPREKQTYFSKIVPDITEIDDLVDSAIYQERLVAINNAIKDNSKGGDASDFYERRNQFLDHLIARFAEKFSDYTFIMKMIYGEGGAKHQILKAKTKFLDDYKKISCERGIGFNYGDSEVWNTENVSGVQKRVARLTGISDFSRRNLLTDAIEVYDEIDKVQDNLTEYRWRIKNGEKILISSSKHYHTITGALNELLYALELAKDASNYDLKKTKNGRTYFNIVDPAISDKKSEDWIVARRIAYTSTQEKSEQKRNEIIAFLNELSMDQEGMYLIEHILLRPDTSYITNAETDNEQPEKESPNAPPETFMPSCLDGDCETCGPLDPYSFRVSVVLPGWTQRFFNADFRAYMERIIREELPAHVLAKICWVGHIKGVVSDKENDIFQIQEKYPQFLNQLKEKSEKKTSNSEDLKRYRETLAKFIPCLNGLHSIYRSGSLHDCDNDGTENKGNKIILGRTNIGNLKA